MTDTYLFVQANSYGINYINKRGLLRWLSSIIVTALIIRQYIRI